MTDTIATTIDSLIDRVIEREGGFVNNAVDRGGPTNFGITIGTLNSWRRAPVGAEDVRTLTREEARQIYRSLYVTAPGFDRVTDPNLLELLFDYGVTSGPGTATKALQAALGVAADGVAGPLTLGALAKYANPERLYWKVLCQRYGALLRYVGSDPRQAVFAVGWANRLQAFDAKVT